MTPWTHAADTAARLHDATRAGVSLLIPGALERQASQPPPRPPIAPVASGAPAAVASDRGRLEHEREGGGAPGARSGRPPGFLARLAHCLLYPADLPILWRHAPQSR